MKINIENHEFTVFNIPTQKSVIIMIKSQQGFVGCGYFDISTANRLGEAVAIVTGVKSYEDILENKVVKVSENALALGIEPGMSGKEALLRLS